MSARPKGRGQATRQALLAAALEAFGRDGFEAASTRAIAARAGVNQALIGFHFGGKKGLYRATLEHVLGRIGERMGPLLSDIGTELERARDRHLTPAARRRRYLPHVRRITDALVAMFTSRESRAWARLILREQQDPGEAFDAYYDGSIGNVLDVFTALIAHILNRDPDARELRMLALTVVGQALIFRAASAAALRHLGRRQFGPEDIASIQALIRRNVDAMLRAAAAS